MTQIVKLINSEQEHAKKCYRINFEESDSVTEDKLLKICDRSVSIHGLYEVLEEGDTYKELVEHLKDNPDDNRRAFYNKEFAFRKRYNKH